MRLALVAILAAVVFGLRAVLPSGDAAAGAIKVTVNSTANTDDGDCDHPPTGTDDCTLHEAIDAVNAGLADEINFHPPTFPPAQKAVINLEGGEGCLPIITREVTIDATNAGVILDGDQDDDETPISGCAGALHIEASHNGFDFALLSSKGDGGSFLIRQFDDAGVAYHGVGFSAGDVTIDMVDIEDVTGNGIEITGGTTNLNNVAITGNNIQTEGTDFYENGGDGVFIETDFTDLTDNNVEVSGNEIRAGDDAVDIEVNGDLNDEGDTPRKVAVDVVDNPVLTSGDEGGDNGVEIDYCAFSSCSADNSAINIAVNDNGEITGQENGVTIEVNADEDSDSLDVNVDMNGNANVDAGNDDGLDADINVCCETSDSVATVNVNGNADVIAEDDAVDLDADVGCGDNNEAHVNVNENGQLQGEEIGVDISTAVGEVVGGCGSLDSDNNVNEVNVLGNNRIDGGSDNGVEIDGEVGSFGGDSDENTSEVHVDENADIDGGNPGDDDGGDGVEIEVDVGSDDGQADENEQLVTVNDNGDIDGGGSDGVDIDLETGVDAGACDPGPGCDGDTNSTEVEVNGNETITGHQDDGVDIEVDTGGTIDGSDENSNLISVNDNGDIRGQNGVNDDDAVDDGDGIFIDPLVCCDSANTNTINIMDNTGEIVGLGNSGIHLGDDVEAGFQGICCSVNTITISDNAGDIRGNDDDGLEVNICTYDGDLTDITECLGTTLTILTVTNNRFVNSEDDGISACCGAMELTGVGKSLISDNVISGNGEDGIDIDTMFGLNIEHNEIFGNGTDDDDSGVEIDTFTADEIFDDFGLTVPSHNNTISENSIYDNVKLGIDLKGSEGDPGDREKNEDSLVGCIPHGDAPIDANDCIPYPVITIIAAGDKVGGTACSQCTVELFLADATPADQTGPLGRQHGEGRTFLVAGEADEDGDFSIVLPCGLSAGDITATATDKVKNTSEFAANAPFLGSRSCATDTPTITNTVPAPTATNTSPPPPPTATPETKACGDVNDDGATNSIDAQLVLQLKAGLIDSLVNEPSADANGDGEITSVDAALILQLDAGLITPADLDCP
jgi:hypothetical protein